MLLLCHLVVISIKGKAKNLTQLRAQVKVNDKSVAVDPLKFSTV